MSRGASIRVSLVLASLMLLAACAGTPARQSPPRYLLLGEVHDNPAGHQQRYDYLRQLVEDGWRPAIVMEQFDRERAEDLRLAMHGCQRADCVIDKAGGKRWNWTFYRPILELALKYQLTVLAGNISRTDAARVIRQGMSAVISADDAKAFSIPGAITGPLAEAQRDEIEKGHCGKVPAGMLAGFINAQVARDIWMAKTMLDNAQQGVVLIAGNGHVRRDWAVPYWLRQRGISDMRVVGFVESGAQANPSIFDVVHTVVPHPRPDPCAALHMPPAPRGSGPAS